MRVFLAGPSREIERVWAARKALLDMGAECSSSWIDPVAEMRAAGKRDLDLSDAEKLSAARANFADIVGSDAMWLLYPKASTYSRGTGPELGYALCACIPVVVSGYDARDDVYAACTTARFGADALAAAWLAENRDELLLRRADDSWWEVPASFTRDAQKAAAE